MHFGVLMYRIVTKLNALIAAGKVRFYYRHIFRNFGAFSSIKKPIIINNPKNIVIGNYVKILHGAWLSGPPQNNKPESKLRIGNHCAIGNHCHIYATDQITIEDKVLIADKVYISDNLHNYQNVFIAVIDQDLVQLSKVTIGEGSWIGENVCIIGASIGKNCVIGANAVVTKDIPDYTVAVGIPAKVIKKFNQESKIWQGVK